MKDGKLSIAFLLKFGDSLVALRLAATGNVNLGVVIEKRLSGVSQRTGKKTLRTIIHLGCLITNACVAWIKESDLIGSPVLCLKHCLQ